MAKIPKIYGTSEVKTILANKAKLQNFVGQCCWTKLWIDRLNLWWLSSTERRTRDAPPPPPGTLSPQRLLRSLKFGLETIDFVSAPERNSLKKISMPWTNVAKISDVFSPFLANPVWQNYAHLRERGGGGGGGTCQILVRYVPQQNQNVDP